MKEGNNHPAAQAAWEEYGFKRFFCALLVVLSLAAGSKSDAQSCAWNTMFHHGEHITYDLYFKWGILMPKAGQAHFTVKDTEYDNRKAWEYQLMFHTTGMIDKVFKMGDTLTTWFTPECQIIFSDKRTEEGGYYLLDQMAFTPAPDNQTSVHSFRAARSGTKIDTTLIVEGCVYDMMAVMMYLRSIAWDKLKIKDEFPFRVVVGRDVVNGRFRYTGQSVVVPPEEESVKYRTHHFFIDIYDAAFEQSREAAEVWVGDDANRIPIRVRAKLKIGAAEVHFKSSSNLRHPLSSRIVISSR
jgi:hypothetical protein